MDLNHVNYLLLLGADKVIITKDKSRDEVTELINKATYYQGIKYAVDYVGGDTAVAIINSLTD